MPQTESHIEGSDSREQLANNKDDLRQKVAPTQNATPKESRGEKGEVLSELDVPANVSDRRDAPALQPLTLEQLMRIIKVAASIGLVPDKCPETSGNPLSQRQVTQLLSDFGVSEDRFDQALKVLQQEERLAATTIFNRTIIANELGVIPGSDIRELSERERRFEEVVDKHRQRLIRLLGVTGEVLTEDPRRIKEICSVETGVLFGLFDRANNGKASVQGEVLNPWQVHVQSVPSWEFPWLRTALRSLGVLFWNLNPREVPATYGRPAAVKIERSQGLCEIQKAAADADLMISPELVQSKNNPNFYEFYLNLRPKALIRDL